MSRIFISHSSANNAAALALGSWLEANGWSDYFLDIGDDRGIVPGERWMAALAGAVDRCEAVIFLLSPAWRDSKYCFTEFFEAKKLGKRIFGVIVEPIPLAQLPEQMTAEWQVCDLTGRHDTVSFTVTRLPSVRETAVSFSASGLRELAHGLRRAGLDASTFVWPPDEEPDRSPYPGLRAMEEVDAPVFFGRDASIVRAIDQIRLVRERGVERLFVILGASGAGKSSFLRAGLLPRLKRDTEHFIVLPTIRPERAAISGAPGLLNCLRAALASVNQPVSPAQVRDELATGGLAGVLQRVAGAAERANKTDLAPPTLVVPVDQAEELFASDGRAEARQFLSHVHALGERLSPGPAESTDGRRVRVLFVLTIRSDSLPRLQGEAAFQRLSPILFSLPAMPVSEFKAVIEGPAERHTKDVKPLIITPQLTEQLVLDAQGVDALPLLALTLEWLYREFTSAQGTRLRLDEYERLGGVRGVIGMAVERALERPGSEPAIPAPRQEQERLLQLTFPYIATVDPDSGDWKRRVALREVMRRKVPQADGLISRLIEQRLLSSDARPMAGGAEPVEVVEVAHEALLRQWDMLERWLREFAAALAASESIRRSASDWQRSNRDPVLLVHTAHRLELAESLLRDERLEGRFEPVDAEYLAACRERAQRERQEREEQLQRIAEQQAARAVLQRRVTWVLSAAAVVVLGLVVWIVMQTREVSRQTALVLLGAAESAADQKRFDQSLRLVVLASRAPSLGAATPDALYTDVYAATKAWTLRTVIDAGRVVAIGTDELVSASFSPDGTRVLTCTSAKARMWDAHTGGSLGQPIEAETASFTPDGARVLTSTRDESRLWKVGDGRAVAATMPGGRASLSADGKRIVTLDQLTPRVYDAESGQPVAQAGALQLIDSVSLNRDGNRMLTVDNFEAQVWDVASGNPIGMVIDHDEVVSMAMFSSDSKRVLTVTAAAARIWDAETGKPITDPLTHGNASRTNQDQSKPADPLERGPIANRIVAASFSPDGTRVVTVSIDKTARIWDADTGKLTAGPLIHQDAVSSALFSPDNRLVVTTSGERAHVWSADDGTPVGDPKVHDANVVSANFSSDSRRVVTTVLGGTALVWELKPLGLDPFESVGDSGRLRAAFGSWMAFQSWWSGLIWNEGVCKNFLRGNVGVIREADIRAARLLPPSRVGEDLCEGVWTGGR